MPRVEIVQKHNTAARRLYIRGHNGKIYPYLVMNDACLTESRREERVLQLLRLLNPCLEKRKETTKRHLFFTGTRATPRGQGSLGHWLMGRFEEQQPHAVSPLVSPCGVSPHSGSAS